MVDHIHTYDAEGKITCCSLEEKINVNVERDLTSHTQEIDTHDHDHDGHDHDHSYEGWKSYIPAIIGFSLLIIGLLSEYYFKLTFFTGYWKLIWYLAAYIPVGYPVIVEAWEALRKGQLFTEFFLMTLATIGAFIIGEYPEGVAVMLFYAIGELFQTAAVRGAKKNISALLDVRPKSARVFRNNTYQEEEPVDVQVGETIQIRAGEKIPLDGKLISAEASLNTSAITGESRPQRKLTSESVLAGFINLEQVIEIEVTKPYAESSIARILELVQNATAKKSKTELLIRRLAKIYTPIVVYLAIAIFVIPFFIVDEYHYQDWLYRALIFLVISCPCALVISIPLGYFGGLGAASRNGLLFKGAKYLDIISKVNTVVLDKTGTLTKGIFAINKINIVNGMKELDFMKSVMSIESQSTHPIAKAIMAYQMDSSIPIGAEIKEISGKGISGKVSGKNINVGNELHLEDNNIDVPTVNEVIIDTIVHVAIDNKYAGYITLSDGLKENAKASIEALRKSGIQEIVMLSGDKDSITQKVAHELRIEEAYGNLLPENKLTKVELLKVDKSKVVAFVGDGINDAPVLAASDLGIAMGGLGSDVAIETADVIIQTDNPYKISTGIKIGKSTQRIIWQNIYLAFGVKVIVLLLGAGGIATMWEAVFADVGVALLAILNAIRLQHMEWN